MNTPSEPTPGYARFFFALTFLLILYVFFRMLEPFLVSIILGLTLASLTFPSYNRLRRRLGERRGISAMIMCTIVTLLIILPVVLFVAALFRELNSAYVEFRMEIAQGGFANFPPWEDHTILGEVWNRLATNLGMEQTNPALALSTLVDRGAKYLLDHYSAILGGLGSLIVKFFIMIFSMFFFFRDGERFVDELKKLVPLNPRYEDMVLAKLKEVTYATFFGVFATGISQGLCAAVIFYFLGIQNPILWGTATAVFSLIPVVGTAAVWVPMAVYLMISGAVVKGVVLLVLGGTVIGLVDNIVRPLIIEGKSAGMHLLLVFFSLLGGLMLFGPAGLIIGPLIAATLVTFLEIYKIEYEEELS